MRALFSVAVLCLVAVGCAEVPQDTAQQPAAVDTQQAVFNAESAPTVEIDVPGLHCEHCSATACEMLCDLPGVVDVKADPESKKVIIAEHEGEFDSEAARSALEEQFGEATIVAGEQG